MGISANQARLMTLTARQHDLELRAQQISAKKMVLSLQSQQFATAYSASLNEYSLMKNGSSTVEYVTETESVVTGYEYDGVTYSDIMDIPYKTVVTGKDDDGNEITEEQPRTADDEGVTVLTEDIPTEYATRNYTDEETSSFLSITKGNYDSAMTALSTQEKIMDMELTQINTEHQAFKTEYDSLKSLIGDNVDKSFNIFG